MHHTLTTPSHVCRRNFARQPRTAATGSRSNRCSELSWRSTPYTSYTPFRLSGASIDRYLRQSLEPFWNAKPEVESAVPLRQLRSGTSIGAKARHAKLRKPPLAEASVPAPNISPAWKTYVERRLRQIQYLRTVHLISIIPRTSTVYRILSKEKPWCIFLTTKGRPFLQ